MKGFKPRDFIKILKDNDWVLERSQGSHCIFIKEGNPNILSVPIHREDLNRPLTNKLLKLASISVN